MADSHQPSVEDLRRESEQARADLTNTVVHLRGKVSETAEDLKARLSPSNIKEEVKDYVRSGSEQFLHTLEHKARQNPLATVAIGAGLAYPLLSVAKSLPMPIMLIGAGLWWSQRGRAQESNLSASQPAGPLSQTWTDGKAAVGNALAAMSSSAEQATGQVKATVHDIRDSVSRTGEALAGKVQEVAGTVHDTIGKISDSAAETAADLTDRVSDLGDRAENAAISLKSAVTDLAERHPMLVGGLCLAVGAFVAAALPRTTVEDQAFGEASDRLKESAAEATSEAVERAKSVTAETVRGVSEEARRQGLTTEDLGRSIEGATQGVRSVMDKGMKAALGQQDASVSAVSSSPHKN